MVWLMLPAGDPTEETVVKLSKLLDRGDLIVDGGNSRWTDDKRRAQALKRSGIEYVDVGNTNQWQADEVVPGHEIVDRINAKWPIEPAQPNYFGEVAERWRYIDGAGEIGVITSVTQPFCGSCTRARLSSDGEVFTCLFASSGFDIRARVRSGASDDELAEVVANIWRARDDRYSEIRASAGATKKVEMFHIVG